MYFVHTTCLLSFSLVLRSFKCYHQSRAEQNGGRTVTPGRSLNSWLMPRGLTCAEFAGHARRGLTLGSKVIIIPGHARIVSPINGSSVCIANTPIPWKCRVLITNGHVQMRREQTQRWVGVQNNVGGIPEKQGDAQGSIAMARNGEFEANQASRKVPVPPNSMLLVRGWWGNVTCSAHPAPIRRLLTSRLSVEVSSLLSWSCKCASPGLGKGPRACLGARTRQMGLEECRIERDLGPLAVPSQAFGGMRR